MVDLIGFLSLGIFTAHITGNIVVIWRSRRASQSGKSRTDPGYSRFYPCRRWYWLLARASGRSAPVYCGYFSWFSFCCSLAWLIFSVSTKPSANPDGLIGCIAAMMAVSAMACHFALLRLGLPVAPSTAVMTGNFDECRAVLSGQQLRRTQRLTAGHTRDQMPRCTSSSAFSEDTLLPPQPSRTGRDWAWSLPAVLAGVPVAVRMSAENL